MSKSKKDKHSTSKHGSDKSSSRDRDRRRSRFHSPGAEYKEPYQAKADRDKAKKDGSGRTSHDTSRSQSAAIGEVSDKREPRQDGEHEARARDKDGGSHIDKPSQPDKSLPGAAVGSGADLTGLGSMIAQLIDQKFDRLMQTQPRKRRRSPSPLSSNDDEDSDTDHEKQAGRSGGHDGHRRKPPRSHSAQMRMREGRGQHGDGNSSYDTSSDSEDSDIAGDPFAALDQFAVKPAQSKSAPIDDKYEEAISAIAKFFDGGNKVSDNVQDSLASIFEFALRRQPNDKMLLDIVDKYPRPQNIPNLTVPKTNDGVWDAMKRGPQVADAGLQKIQTVISKSLVPVISIIDNIGQPGGSDRPIAHYLEPLTDVVRLLSAALSLLSQARKDIIRNDMGYPISKLCNWKYKVGGDQLFEDDLMKKLRELKEQHTQFKNPRPGPSSSRFGGHRSDRDYYRERQNKPFKRYNKKKNNFFNKSMKFPKKKRDCEYDVSETQNVANVTLVTDSHEDIHDSSHAMSSCEYDLHNTPKNFKGVNMTFTTHQRISKGGNYLIIMTSGFK